MAEMEDVRTIFSIFSFPQASRTFLVPLIAV